MFYSTFDLENSLWSRGLKNICGVDEVGRGCFAGPVVTGAVVFPPNCLPIEGAADSKLLKAKDRENLAVKIKNQAISWAVGVVDVDVINKIGIGKATQLAFIQAVRSLTVLPDWIMIDAFYIDGLDKKNQQPVKNGDKISTSIAAASIVAKVFRDDLMQKLHLKFPDYGFDAHKGYGTKAHRDAIKRHGLSDIHRKSFNLAKFL